MNATLARTEPLGVAPPPAAAPAPFRILVTGSRRATAADRRVVWDRLDWWHTEATSHGRTTVVVHGAAAGVDTLAAAWAAGMRGVTPEPHPAEAFGPWPRCGPIRNAHMVGLGASVCLAFTDPAVKGTLTCLEMAIRAGIYIDCKSLRTFEW